MRYMKAIWQHDFPDEPSELYSEIDDDKEVRKVDVYGDGRIGLAGRGRETGTTWLAEGPMPTVEQIDSMDDFEAKTIDASTFEGLWIEAIERRPFK